MRTVSGVAKTRAAARRRAARAMWAQRVRTVRSQLRIESPLGMAGICLGSALVLSAALFPVQFSPFAFALHSLVGLQADQQPLAETRVGEIFFTPFDGNACRKVRFDNQTGSFGPEEHVRCYGDAAASRVVVQRGDSDRMSMLRQAFTIQRAR